MRNVAATLTLAVAVAATLGAQTPPTAASITEPGRTLARPLDVVLGSAGADATERTLLIVLDPTPGLAGAGFADALATAVAQNQKALARTRLGLGVVGHKGCIVVPPTQEHDKIVDAVRSALQKPGGEFLNVYADLRAAVPTFANSPGERVLLLVSLDNGDVEDDVEQTASALRKAKVKVEVLTSEATLADCYWARHNYQQAPRGTALTGADGAVIDLPWGWLFQVTPANEMTPAGFAMWGLSRLAAATSGRVFLHATSNQTGHQCGVFSACLFCNGDHLAPDDNWNSALVNQLAPLVTARNDVLGTMGSDPAYRAMIDTWRQAAEAGLVHGHPPVRVTGTSATPDRARPGRDLDLTDSANFERSAKKAEEAAQRARVLAEQLQAQLGKLGAEQANPRALAAAHYTVVLLQLTRVNLLTFAGFCREIAPQLFDKGAPAPLPPEVPSVDSDQRPVGIGYSNLCLCHGVRPFYEIELPGGPALRRELEQLDALFTAFQQRYGQSQFGLALRRNGIARFWPSFPGIAGKPPRQRPKSGSDTAGPVTPSRPTRAGPGSTGGASGPTTGGGR